MIRYKCPHCQEKLENEDARGGKVDVCPRCQGVHTVPQSKAQKWMAKEREKEERIAIKAMQEQKVVVATVKKQATREARLIKCPACNRDVSSKAPACPGCGHQLRSAAQIKKDEFEAAGGLTGYLIGIIVLVISVMFVGLTCDSSDSTTKRDDAGKTWDEAKQPERMQLIQKLCSAGVFQDVEFRSGAATIWVSNAFYTLDFEKKQNFCSVVYAYVSTKARDKLVPITLKDSRSGKTAGSYGQHWNGFGLKME